MIDFFKRLVIGLMLAGLVGASIGWAFGSSDVIAKTARALSITLFVAGLIWWRDFGMNIRFAFHLSRVLRNKYDAERLARILLLVVGLLFGWVIAGLETKMKLMSIFGILTFFFWDTYWSIFKQK